MLTEAWQLCTSCPASCCMAHRTHPRLGVLRVFCGYGEWYYVFQLLELHNSERFLVKKSKKLIGCSEYYSILCHCWSWTGCYFQHSLTHFHFIHYHTVLHHQHHFPDLPFSPFSTFQVHMPHLCPWSILFPLSTIPLACLPLDNTLAPVWLIGPLAHLHMVFSPHFFTVCLVD